MAVSGGVDSVALLHALYHHKAIARCELPRGDIIVAHFDHGIRSESAQDAAFVKNLAAAYGVKYVSKREELGEGASEEQARQRRYAFLFETCKVNNAMLVTAHHADDAVETVAINMTRGTGWRGLAVLNNTKILRPLLGVTKQDLLDYAHANKLQWHEDGTNSSDRYLRNRLRKKLENIDEDTKWQVLALRSRQTELKEAIDNEAARLIGQSPYKRYFFSHMNDVVALELLRMVFVAEIGTSPAIQPRMRALHAIKVAKPNTTIDVADHVRLRFTTTHFIVETTA